MEFAPSTPGLQRRLLPLSSRPMRILSGIQPSGTLHLGNYFGMMRPAIALQEKGEAYYFIADYHSMTSLTDATERRANSLGVALDFLACGLDPQRAVFFRTAFSSPKISIVLP